MGSTFKDEMAFRMRSSKFRHVYGSPNKKEHCYECIKITKNAHDSNFCAVNPKFLAVVTECAGGGTFMVIPVEKVGRQDYNSARVSGHSGKVLDIKWNPFNDNVIASCSEDATIKLWFIPDGGLRTNLVEWLIDLHGHSRRVGYIEWHPTAENIILSAGYDFKCIVWNTETGESLTIIDVHHDTIFSIAWNRDGSLFATTSKDKKIRVIEPRDGTLVAEGNGHTGSKASKVVFLGDKKRILTTGFSRTSERQYAIWNVDDLSKPLKMDTIDSSSGVITPFFDFDTNVIFLVGKGDGNIRYFELVDNSPYSYYLDQYQSPDPQRGCGIMPKRGIDTKKCEIVRFYKLHTQKNMVEPVSMVVPRKSEMFQADIFTPTASGCPSLTANDWFNGQNRDPILISLKDGDKLATGNNKSTKRHSSYSSRNTLSLSHPQLNGSPENHERISRRPEGMTPLAGATKIPASVRNIQKLSYSTDNVKDLKLSKGESFENINDTRNSPHEPRDSSLDTNKKMRATSLSTSELTNGHNSQSPEEHLATVGEHHPQDTNSDSSTNPKEYLTMLSSTSQTSSNSTCRTSSNGTVEDTPSNFQRRFPRTSTQSRISSTELFFPSLDSPVPDSPPSGWRPQSTNSENDDLFITPPSSPMRSNVECSVFDSPKRESKQMLASPCTVAETPQSTSNVDLDQDSRKTSPISLQWQANPLYDSQPGEDKNRRRDNIRESKVEKGNSRFANWRSRRTGSRYKTDVISTDTSLEFLMNANTRQRRKSQELPTSVSLDQDVPSFTRSTNEEYLEFANMPKDSFDNTLLKPSKLRASVRKRAQNKESKQTSSENNSSKELFSDQVGRNLSQSNSNTRLDQNEDKNNNRHSNQYKPHLNLSKSTSKDADDSLSSSISTIEADDTLNSFQDDTNSSLHISQEKICLSPTSPRPKNIVILRDSTTTSSSTDVEHNMTNGDLNITYNPSEDSNLDSVLLANMDSQMTTTLELNGLSSTESSPVLERESPYDNLNTAVIDDVLVDALDDTVMTPSRLRASARRRRTREESKSPEESPSNKIHVKKVWSSSISPDIKQNGEIPDPDLRKAYFLQTEEIKSLKDQLRLKDKRIRQLEEELGRLKEYDNLQNESNC